MIIIDLNEKTQTKRRDTTKRGIWQVLILGFSAFFDFRGKGDHAAASKWNMFWLSALAVLVFLSTYGLCADLYYDELARNTSVEGSNVEPDLGLIGLLLIITLCVIFFPTLSINYRSSKKISDIIAIVILYFFVCVVTAVFAGFLAIIIIPIH